MKMEFTDGARRPSSASTIAASPATAVAYDQKLGGTSRMILAGQVNYDGDAPARRHCHRVAPNGEPSAPARTRR